MPLAAPSEDAGDDDAHAVATPGSIRLIHWRPGRPHQATASKRTSEAAADVYGNLQPQGTRCQRSAGDAPVACGAARNEVHADGEHSEAAARGRVSCSRCATKRALAAFDEGTGLAGTTWRASPFTTGMDCGKVAGASQGRSLHPTGWAVSGSMPKQRNDASGVPSAPHEMSG